VFIMVDKCCELKIWPASYVGIPSLLLSAALILFTFSLMFQIYEGTSEHVAFWFPLAGIVLALFSIGRDVTITDGKIVLSYGYPIPAFKLAINDVVQVVDVNNLERGRLFKYFKSQLILITVVIIYPLLYILVKGSLPPIQYLTFFSLPIFVGLALISYFMMTTNSYRKFIKYAGWIMSGVCLVMDFLIGYYYRQLFGRSVTADMHALIPLMIGQVLAITFFVVVTVFRRHVIVLEDSRGKYYAVIATTEEYARQFIGLVVRRVMAHA